MVKLTRDNLIYFIRKELDIPTPKSILFFLLILTFYASLLYFLGFFCFKFLLFYHSTSHTIFVLLLISSVFFGFPPFLIFSCVFKNGFYDWILERDTLLPVKLKNNGFKYYSMALYFFDWLIKLFFLLLFAILIYDGIFIVNNSLYFVFLVILISTLLIENNIILMTTNKLKGHNIFEDTAQFTHMKSVNGSSSYFNHKDHQMSGHFLENNSRLVRLKYFKLKTVLLLLCSLLVLYFAVDFNKFKHFFLFVFLVSIFFIGLKRIFHYRFFSSQKIRILYTLIISTLYLLIISSLLENNFSDILSKFIFFEKILLFLSLNILIYPYHWAIDGNSVIKPLFINILIILASFCVAAFYVISFESGRISESFLNLILLEFAVFSFLFNLLPFLWMLALLPSQLSATMFKIPTAMWSNYSKKGRSMVSIMDILMLNYDSNLLIKNKFIKRLKEINYIDLYNDKRYKREKIIYRRLLWLDALVSKGENLNQAMLFYSGLNKGYLNFDERKSIFGKHSKVEALWLIFLALENKKKENMPFFEEIYSGINTITGEIREPIWINYLAYVFGDLVYLNSYDNNATLIENALNKIAYDINNDKQLRYNILIRIASRQINYGNYEKALKILDEAEENFVKKERSKNRFLEIIADFSMREGFITAKRGKEIYLKKLSVYSGMCKDQLIIGNINDSEKYLDKIENAINKIKEYDNESIREDLFYSSSYLLLSATKEILAAKQTMTIGEKEKGIEHLMKSLVLLSKIWIFGNLKRYFMKIEENQPMLIEYYLKYEMTDNEDYFENKEGFMADLIDRWRSEKFSLEELEDMEIYKEGYQNENEDKSLPRYHKEENNGILSPVAEKLLDGIETVIGQISLPEIDRTTVILQYELQTRIYIQLGVLDQANIASVRGLEEAKEYGDDCLLWRQYFIRGLVIEKSDNSSVSFLLYYDAVKLIENKRSEIPFNDFDSRLKFISNNYEAYEKLVESHLKKGGDIDALNTIEKCKSRTFQEMMSSKKLKKNNILMSNESVFDNQNNIHITCEEVKKNIDKDTAILDYFFTEDYLIIFVIDNLGMHSEVISISRQEILKNINDVKVNMKFRSRPRSLDKLKKSSAFLFKHLIVPVKKHIPQKKKLIIIPHRHLHKISFGNLFDDQNNRWLIEDYVISYTPNLEVYNFCNRIIKKVRTSGEGILAFAYQGRDENSGYMIDELEMIAKKYPTTQVFKNVEASKSNFLIHCSKYPIIHFACHGVFEEKQPLNSHLVLAPIGNDDGKLKVHEIYDLEIKSRLVILSACETGKSPLFIGEDLIGLVRGFMYAGSPSVIATLWRVSDECTPKLMNYFYDRLIKSETAEALQKAQVELLNEEKYEHPFYWSPFIHFGSSECLFSKK